MIRLGQFTVSSSDIKGLVKFYNDRIFSQVQRSKGLVEYKGSWITPEECALVYINRSLTENPRRRLAKRLAKAVWEKEISCCVCGDKNISFWIIDAVRVTKGLGALIFARLLCKEHERKWKKGEMLNYEKFNGVMFLEMPYCKPVGMWIDMSPEDFLNIGEEHTDATLVEYQKAPHESFESYLTKNAQFVFVGKLKEFLEEK